MRVRVLRVLVRVLVLARESHFQLGFHESLGPGGGTTLGKDGAEVIGGYRSGAQA
jgi:hypothetical protein